MAEGKHWRTVKYPGYRRYNEARIGTNDTMMALLVSARLASHTLKIHEGSTAMLPEVYPAVHGVERVRRTLDDVRTLIDTSERHFAYMAIPYTLANYKQLVVSALIMLRDDGVETHGDDLYRLGLKDAHDRLIMCLDPSHLPHDELALLEFLRQIRNRIEHRAGIEGSSLRREFRALSETAGDVWIDLAGRPFTSTGSGQLLDLDARELIAALAVTTRLARAVNRNLQVTLSRTYWAGLAVRDFRQTSPKGWAQKDVRLRKARAFSDRLYSALRLNEQELRDAITSAEVEEGGSSC